jgi:hypothetical protein
LTRQNASTPLFSSHQKFIVLKKIEIITTNQDYPVGPFFDYDFHSITASKSSFANLHLSVGEEMKLYKSLFVTANVGIGEIIGKSIYIITDADKNELVYKIGTDNIRFKRL